MDASVPLPHAEPSDAVAAHWKVDPMQGLTAQEAAERVHRYGPNQLPEAPTVSWIRRLLGQFASPLVLTLIGAAVLATVVGVASGSASSFGERYGDALAIALIVVLNAALGLFQDRRAETALNALRQMALPRTRVLRGGAVTEIGSDGVVPGDVLMLDAGDAVAADARLVESHSLAAQEAALTGESTAVEKQATEVRPADAPLADRTNMLFMGTVLVRGTGKAVVTATGAGTELGRIGTLIAGAEEGRTPLEGLLNTFGKRVLIGCVAISALLLVWGLLRPHVLPGTPETPWHVLLLGAVSLAVAAIPEGLPAITAISLAMGTQRLAKLGAIVRKLPAVETLGAATFICSDKTGTLTQNEMVVRALWAGDRRFQAEGTGYAPEGTLADADRRVLSELPGPLRDLLVTATLCNHAALEHERANTWKVIGDPTEGALLAVARRGGIDVDALRTGHRIAREIPFDSDRKRMTVIEADGVAHVKGSPEVLLPRCVEYATEGGRAPFDEPMRTKVQAEVEAMGARALRVLALCMKQDGEHGDPEKDLVLLGLVGMMDPPREGVPEAIRACREAGIRVAMITGDHLTTARAVAQEIGILGAGEEAITGPELAALSDEDLARRVETVRVFARTTAEQKLRIVRALKRAGHVVAMTGDGVNDAPALKEANIGVAMGRSGTEVARQAADITLADDNFATIVAAIQGGRAIYRNIQKFLFFLLSSNVGLTLAVFLTSLSGRWLALTPLMILWINLVTNGLPALALGIDPVDPRVMQEVPRAPGAALIGVRDWLGIGFVGAVMAGGALAMYGWNLCDHATGPNGPRTLAFLVLAVAPLLHAWSCRSPSESIFAVRPRLSRPLAVACVLSLGVLLVAVLVPALRPTFQTDGLTTHDWIMVAIASVLVVPAVEVAKSVDRWRSSRSQRTSNAPPARTPARV